MESIRETRDTQSDETSAKQILQRESHRKHLSENGGSLVYGILAALRQNTELESPEFPFPRQADRSAESSISPTMDSDKSLTTDPMNNNNTSTKTSLSAAIPSSVSVSDLTNVSTNVSTVETESESALPVSVNETRESCTIDSRTLSAKEPKENSIEQETKQDPSSMVPESKPIAEPHTSPPSSTKSIGVLDHEKKEGKPSLLQKMGMRKNSFNESSSARNKVTTDSSTKSHTANSAARPKASTKRSSKLLGKFVHKILPISMSSTNSTPIASPQVQTAGLSPLSARASRSSSMASQTMHENETIISAEATATITLPLSPPASSKGSQESLPLMSSPRDEVLSSAPIPEGSSVVFVEIMEDDRGDKTSSAGYFDVEYEHEIIEDDEDENKQKSTEADEALMSPYVIDDDCDDDFFLNSVLRKKLNLTLDVTPERPPVMFSSYPSNTTLDSVHSAPSLSGWSSASSQASTPSPTSTSFPSSQMYPSPSTNTKAPSMHIHYRSNPLPTPVNSGLDEKRTRLRDAVSEWRRSTNASF
ncbi:hypothetical protein BGX21_001736 [Mortierella sp. AD011]|nr:hypothetical protein BGX20_003255 [Mortierella sp. AD010]KAF9382740.1 hypothetical protein BGX21_001736 [Mortierella sp. AD011]